MMPIFTLEQELRFYLADLTCYIKDLEQQCTSFTKSPVPNELLFLESFERNMKTGLEQLIQKKEYHAVLEEIRNASAKLLQKNKDRYVASIIKHKGTIDESTLSKTRKILQKMPLLHATKHKQLIRKNGIMTAANLWQNRIKTCANAMDIALGLHFHSVFCTHGFTVKNFGEDYVCIENNAINRAIVSSVDIYKIVLIKNHILMKGIVPTEKWFIALQDYSTQLFAGKDFIELKAMYITAYFNGNIDAYNTFAGKNFYANQLKYSPPNEYPFLGEIKVPGNITCNYILSA